MSDITTKEIEQEKIDDDAELTWGDLIRIFVENLKSKGKGKQERNFKTAIKFFLEANSLAEDSTVGVELTEEFEAKLDVYIKFQIKRGLSESTYEPRVSKMRALKIFVDQKFAGKLQLQTLPEEI